MAEFSLPPPSYVHDGDTAQGCLTDEELDKLWPDSSPDFVERRRILRNDISANNAKALGGAACPPPAGYCRRPAALI